MFQVATLRDARKFQLLVRNYCLCLQGRSDNPWIEVEGKMRGKKQKKQQSIQCKLSVFCIRNDTLTSMFKYSF
jgi:hypothetical protein